MVGMGTWYETNTILPVMTEQIAGAGVADPAPFTMVTIPYPDVADSGTTVSLFGDPDYGLSVNKDSDQQAAATTFVTWLTATAEGQSLVGRQLALTPSLKAATVDLDAVELVNPEVQEPMLEELLQRQATVVESRFGLLTPGLVQALADAVQGVLEGSVSPEDGAASVQAAYGS
jgi:ABC-type glycerol-3-phosphate transport system substrate-binding protein